jgi:guanylate kinase
MAMNTPKVFIISAPSGAGKTTLVQALLERFPRFEFSISATTRQPRANEQDGVHYYFLTPEEFASRRKADEFLEWEEVYEGRLYGTLRSEVDRILQRGHYPIFDVDVEGGLNIKKQYGSAAVAIFIQAPSLEVLRQRLIGRAADSSEEIERRFRKAEREMTYAAQFDHRIVNDHLPTAIEEICNLVAGHLSGTTT